MAEHRWTADDIPDQGGKLALVTGASSGIGYEAARALAAKGARVILAVRSVEKGEASADAIRRSHPHAALEVMALDLADLASVRRFVAVGADAISVGCHPGYAATNLQAAGPRMSGSRLGAAAMDIANALLGQSAAMGALPTLYAATADGVAGCDYIGPTGLMGMRGYPAKGRSSPRSYDLELARRLWQVSEQLTGVSYDMTAPSVAPA